MNEIKRLTGLATANNNTFVKISSGVIQDVFENDVVSQSRQSVRRFTEDSVSPRLLGFDFDLDLGLLTMTFRETVRTGSLDTSGITFHDGDPLGSSYTLSGFYDSVSPDSTILKIQLTNDDLNELKYLDDLAVSRMSTYLSAKSSTVKDMNSNPLAAVSDVTYVPDQTPPTLTSWTLNMNTGRLKLFFDETVNETTLILPYFSLRDNETVVTYEHEFANDGIATYEKDAIDIETDIYDLNEIKRIEMCTKAEQEENCYLAYKDDAIRDMSGNKIVGC